MNVTNFRMRFMKADYQYKSNQNDETRKEMDACALEVKETIKCIIDALKGTPEGNSIDRNYSDTTFERDSWKLMSKGLVIHHHRLSYDDDLVIPYHFIEYRDGPNYKSSIVSWFKC